MSVAAFQAKAALLFERASRLASQYRPSKFRSSFRLLHLMLMPHADMSNKQQFYVSFNSIDSLNERFKLSLPTVQMYSTKEMLVIHCLVHVATIQLHNLFVADTHASRMRVLDSARAIVAYLAQVPLNEFVYINPIMGVSRLFGTYSFKL
jgi:hypothetical protein